MSDNIENEEVKQISSLTKLKNKIKITMVVVGIGLFVLLKYNPSMKEDITETLQNNEYTSNFTEAINDSIGENEEVSSIFNKITGNSGEDEINKQKVIESQYLEETQRNKEIKELEESLKTPKLSVNNETVKKLKAEIQIEIQKLLVEQGFETEIKTVNVEVVEKKLNIEIDTKKPREVNKNLTKNDIKIIQRDNGQIMSISVKGSINP